MMKKNKIALVCVILLSVKVSLVSEDESRKVLFFDLWKLDAWNNVELKQGEPEWVSECRFSDPSFPDLRVYFPTVWREENGQWRLLFSVKWSPFTLMAGQSDDGITWTPLNVPSVNPGEGQEKLAPNHLLTVPSGSGGVAYRDPKATDGYRFRIFGRQRGEPVRQRALADDQHPWHEAAKSNRELADRYIDEGITLVSRDGVNWEVKAGGQWNWQSDDWYPEPPVFAFWNEKIGKHVMLARPGWGDRRQCWLSSPDLADWPDPQILFQPDPLDTKGPIGMYGMPVHPVGNGAGFVGLLWIFHNSSSERVDSYNQFFGPMDAELTYSYDGVRFFRGKRKPFLPLNPIPRPGCTQIRPGSIVETDEWIHIYSEGHRGAHGRERSEQRLHDESLSSLILHRLRKDGWMYLASQGDWARVQTKPFALREPGIRLNAAADYGEVKFQLTDEKSEPIPGFSFEACRSLRAGNELAFDLEWQDSPDWEEVLDRPLRLELQFRQAKIYSLDMVHHFIDAHDMWMLKDGQELPEKPRFDF